MKYRMAALFILCLVTRVSWCLMFSTAIDNTPRLIPQYNMAANFSKHGTFMVNADFVRKAQQHVARQMESIDYFTLERLFYTGDDDLRTPPITDTWGYAFVLGSLWKVFSPCSLWYIRIFQILLELLAVYCLFHILQFLFGREREYAFYGTLAYVLFPGFAYYSTVADRNYWATWGLIFASYLFLHSLEGKHSPALWFLSALTIVCFNWVRPTIFWFPGLCFLYLWAKGSWKKASACFLLMSLTVIMLFFVPFSRQFYQHHGTYRFWMVSGFQLWTGLGEYPGKYSFSTKDWAAHSRAVKLGYPADGLPYVYEQAVLLRKDAMDVIQKDPVYYLQVILRRYVRYLFSPPQFGISDFYQVSYNTGQKSLTEFMVTHPVIFLEKACKNICGFILPLAAFFSLWVFRKNLVNALFLFLIWKFNILLFLPMIYRDKYLFSVYFPVVVLAAVSAVRIYSGRRDERQS